MPSMVGMFSPSKVFSFSPFPFFPSKKNQIQLVVSGLYLFLVLF